MKVLQFTLPVAHDRTVIVQEDDMPHFYPYLHRHKESQLIWIKEGEGTLVVDNNMHVFKKDDIYYIGANQPHLFKSNPEYFAEESHLNIEAIMVFFDPNGRLAPVLALPEMQPLQAFLQHHHRGFKIGESKRDTIIQRMLSVQYAKGQEILIQFLQLLNAIFQSANELTVLSNERLGAFSEHEGIRIGHIFNYLMQHYTRQITLDEVAAEAHMTPQAFCRYFKKHTRQTFISFLNELRINEACKKLTSGKYEDIASVVYTCGFNSVTNFNRVFKSVKGESPKMYLQHYFQNLKVPV